MQPARSSCATGATVFLIRTRPPPPFHGLDRPPAVVLPAGFRLALASGGVRGHNDRFDRHTFQASVGQGVAIRVAQVGSSVFTPAFSVYDPSGNAVVNDSYGADVARSTFRAAQAGTYGCVRRRVVRWFLNEAESSFSLTVRD